MKDIYHGYWFEEREDGRVYVGLTQDLLDEFGELEFFNATESDYLIKACDPLGELEGRKTADQVILPFDVTDVRECEDGLPSREDDILLTCRRVTDCEHGAPAWRWSH